MNGRNIKYLFIDGAYLQTNYSKISRLWFGVDTPIDFHQILGHYQYPAKVFYYDCLTIKKATENEVQFKGRLKKQKEFIETLRQLPNFHVRLGKLVGGKEKKRQKGVDVQLAVDMMEHAIQKNMNEAVLLSGDRDFEPLVKSIVRMGVHISIAAFPSTTSRRFAYSADSFQPILFQDVWTWTEDQSRKMKPKPQRWMDNHSYKHGGARVLAQGIVHSRLPRKSFEILIADDSPGHRFIIEIPSYTRDGHLHIADSNRESLEFCIEIDVGKIEWKE